MQYASKIIPFKANDHISNNVGPEIIVFVYVHIGTQAQIISVFTSNDVKDSIWPPNFQHDCQKYALNLPYELTIALYALLSNTFENWK